jgi:hypothetical protein
MLEMGVTRRSSTPDVDITLPLACASDFGDGPWEYTIHERSISEALYPYSCEEFILQALVLSLFNFVFLLIFARITENDIPTIYYRP